jgi:GTPase SAR1 family protein
MNKETLPERQLEPQIKASILNHLNKRIPLESYAAIINEFTIGNFSRRVDLAIIDNNDLLAFEVKSEADSLQRLEGQTQKYLKYFDKVIVVAAAKYIPKILNLVPNNVAVWEINNNSIITVRQRGKKIKVTDKDDILELMKVNELRKLSKLLKMKAKTQGRKDVTASLLTVATAKLRNATINSIKQRYSLTTALFLQAIKNKSVTPSDIQNLSANKHERKDVRSNTENISKIIELFDSN